MAKAVAVDKIASDVEAKPFDLDNLQAVIECAQCKQPLWKITVMTKFSHRMEQFGKHSRRWDEKNPLCPLCKKNFYTWKDNGEPVYRIRSVLTHQRFQL